MKVLLINPPILNLIQPETPKFVTMDRGYNPPLGLLTLGAVIKHQGKHEVAVLDTQAEEMDLEQVKAAIHKHDPDIVGMAAITFTLIDCLNVARIAKEINPAVKVVLGGPHATLFPRETAIQPEVDIVVTGEGEIVFPQIVDNIDNLDSLKHVKGIVYQNDQGEVIATGPAELIENLDELPFPDRELTDYRKYSSVIAKRQPITTMVTSRGCPFRCTFCDRPQMGGKTWRARSPKNIVDEMEVCVNMGIHEIMFYDDTFTMVRPRTVEICEEIIKRKLDVGWDCRTRVDRVDKELLQLMKKAGCERVNYGVESGTERGLKIVKKDVKLPRVLQAFKDTRDVGLTSLGYFMVGLPTETREEMYQTIKFAKKVRPDFVHFTVFTPFPDTEVWRDILAKGDNSVREAWRGYAEKPSMAFDPPTYNGNLSKEELFKVAEDAYKLFYLRPDYMVKEALKIRSVGEFKRKFKAGMKILRLAAT